MGCCCCCCKFPAHTAESAAVTPQDCVRGSGGGGKEGPSKPPRVDGAAALSHAESFTIGGGKTGPGDADFLAWITKRRPALPEYRKAASTICVRPELMAHSRTAAAVQSLVAATKKSAVPGNFETVAIRAIRKAWPAAATDDSKARSLGVDVPGLASGNPLNGARSTHGSLPSWQKDLLHKALHHLAERSSEDELRVVFGLLMRGASECHSRKAWAFYAIVARCVPLQPEVVGNPLAAARARILAAVEEFLDDEKDAAFQTYFVEPTWMYLRAVGSGSPDVQVHGANTYIAALAAALGVRLSREPFLGDESKGVAPFLEAKFKKGELEALQRPENLGKAWEAVRECRDPQVHNGARTDRRWIRDGGSPHTSAKLAISDDVAARKRLQPYLEAFASAFAAERLLPRVFSRLVQVDALTAALNVELAAFHGEGRRADALDDGSEQDCRYFVWDLESQPPTFRLRRFALLMERVGVLKALRA